MKVFDISFGQLDFKQTAQFFNPKVKTETSKIKMPQPSKLYKKKRENSMPQNNFIRLEELVLTKCPQILTKQMVQRRTNTMTNKDIEALFKKKTITQQSTQESEYLMQTFKEVNKLQHSQSSYNVPKNFKSIDVTRESRANSRCSVMSQGGERKRKIKVNDPYGLFTLPKYTAQTKSFVNQKAQIKLVDRIFSSRSDSIQ